MPFLKGECPPELGNHSLTNTKTGWGKNYQRVLNWKGRSVHFDEEKTSAHQSAPPRLLISYKREDQLYRVHPDILPRKSQETSSPARGRQSVCASGCRVLKDHKGPAQEASSESSHGKASAKPNLRSSLRSNLFFN